MATPDASLEALIAKSIEKALARARRSGLGRDSARKLDSIQLSFVCDSRAATLRQLDSAWRSIPPEDLPTFAPLYARLLALEPVDHSATLGMLLRARDSGPDADLGALHVLTWLRSDRTEEACNALKEALAQYCVETGGLLAAVAAELVRHPAIAAPGWVGRGPGLEPLGQLSPQRPTPVLDVKIGGRASVAQLLYESDRTAGGTLDFRLPQFSAVPRLEVSSAGVELLGSDLPLPADFGLDGCIQAQGRRLQGWTRLGWRPGRAPRVRIQDETGCQVSVAPLNNSIGAHQWPLKLDLRTSRIRGYRLDVSVELPDRRWQTLPDSPLLLAPALRARRGSQQVLSRWVSPQARPVPVSESKRSEWVDVIVPIYRGLEESLACINSVLATVNPRTVRVVLVDDATDDTALAQALDTLAASGQVTLLRNPENLGFVRSVNRGLALDPTRDVVILNSDTVVFSDWLERLRAAAHSATRVGTVTPLSNNGSIASYPALTGSRIDPQAGRAFDEMARQLNAAQRIDIPVGVGFCLYIRRDCLREVGQLDADIFGYGYGEETDFCLRARHRGWLHRLATDVFVYHAGALSFGKRRERLLQRSQRLLNLRHPHYDRFIASYLAQDPVASIRRRLDEQRLKSLSARLALLVTASLTGGVERFVRERGQDLRNEGLIVLLLRPVAVNDTSQCELWTDELDLPNLRYRIPLELKALRLLLRALSFETIEIQHFLHLDARIIEAVRSLCQPYDVFIHDYVWICPRITLIDDSGRYCGEPPVAACERCVKRNGAQLGEAITVSRLRLRSKRWLSQARRVIAPSADTAKRLQRYFAGANIEVRPHSARIERAAPVARKNVGVVRVALLGAIGQHKGYDVLLKCARHARARGLQIQFVVIGYTENDARLLTCDNIFITGRYSDSEVTHLIEREAPDILWLPCVWPETWSYTLDHALRSGLPIVTFELGAVAERLREVNDAALLPLTASPGYINDVFLELARMAPTVNGSITTELGARIPYAYDDSNVENSQYGDTRMNSISNGKPEQSEQEGLSASVQVLPLPPGLYLFSVRSASPVVAAATGKLSLPAVHVGLGPGVPIEAVEFVGGPSTHGGWLFALGDLLVVKVTSNGATLVLTSMRAPGGEVLSIKVEKLEARLEEAESQHVSTTRQPPRATDRGSANKRTAASDDETLSVAIGAHVRTRGDMSFSEVPWAGRIAPGLWIECFSVRPLQRFGPQDIEYKALTASGFETPWLSENKMCGTKGMSTPLLGFAIRLRPSPAAAAYDCEYSGYFASGVTVGPVKNGVPCRSSVASDPLEGIQVRLVKRSAAMLPDRVRTVELEKSAVKKKAKLRGAGNRAAAGRNVRQSRRPSSRGS